MRAGDLEAARDRLLALPFWPGSYDGTHRSLAALKDLTSQLIGRFCLAAERATRERHGVGPLRRYAANLCVPADVRLEVELLKTVAARWMMEGPEAEQRYGRQRAVVTELVEALGERPEGLEPWLRGAYEQAADDAARLRVVVDQVASLTDTSALAWHERIVGG